MAPKAYKFFNYLSTHYSRGSVFKDIGMYLKSNLRLVLRKRVTFSQMAVPEPVKLKQYIHSVAKKAKGQRRDKILQIVISTLGCLPADVRKALQPHRHQKTSSSTEGSMNELKQLSKLKSLPGTHCQLSLMTSQRIFFANFKTRSSQHVQDAVTWVSKLVFYAQSTSVVISGQCNQVTIHPSASWQISHAKGNLGRWMQVRTEDDILHPITTLQW